MINLAMFLNNTRSYLRPPLNKLKRDLVIKNKIKLLNIVKRLRNNLLINLRRPTIEPLRPRNLKTQCRLVRVRLLLMNNLIKSIVHLHKNKTMLVLMRSSFMCLG